MKTPINECVECGLPALPNDELCGACFDEFREAEREAEGYYDPDDVNDPGVPNWPD